jgi:8-oxo-dGTP pyrophosphatase MutT (NUDIX family)
VGAGFVLYKNQPQMRVLCLLKKSGKLDLPKGHSNPEDLNLFFTAQRECFEEAGVFVNMHDLMTKDVFQDEDLTMFCASTHQDVEIGINPVTNKLEHVGYVWLSPRDAIELLPDHLGRAVIWSLQFVSNT